MPLIPVGHGLHALVDHEDYDWLARYRWSTTRGYAYRGTGADEPNPGRTVRMHREILKAPAGSLVDHINRQRLDNRRANLRLCTPSQNVINRDWGFGSSHFRGISWRRNRWEAGINVHGLKYYLGRFRSEEDAARAYDEAALRLHGEFAQLNFPDAEAA